MSTETLFAARDAAAAKPVLPAPGETAAPEILKELRRFHLGLPAAEPAPPLPEGLLPALLHGVAAAPAGGEGVQPAGEGTPLALLAEAAAARRAPAREVFLAAARELAAATEAVLAADAAKRPESRAADALGGAMGGLAGRFLNAGALAGVVAARAGAGAMDAERRRRLEAALATLTAFGRPGDDAPAELVAVHDGSLAATAGRPGWRLESADDPCAAAAALFDAQAAALAEVLRAARLARLEVDGAYDPARHDLWLTSFDWQGFSADELLLLPTVAAVVSADQVARRGLLSLSRLLLSGRPVQVVLMVDPATSPGADPGADPLAGFRFEPGYLGLGHREALVTQSALARPEHLAAGFARAVGAGRAALHVVATDGADDPRRAEAALAGRAHPLFQYDPGAGASWARRLDFAGNPEPAEDWPREQLAVATPDGNASVLDLAFTFADYALLAPAFAGAFRAAPAGVPAGELAPLADWLALAFDAAAAKLPFVWAVDAAGRLHRLVVSRRLALACRDRLATWRTLQELAGVRSEYVTAAEARVREELAATAATERAALEARHAGELAALERRSVERVVDRLTSALLEVDVAAFAPAAATGSPLAALGGPGASVDEVSAHLLQLLESAPPAAGNGGAPPPDPRVDQLAAELLATVAERNSP
jgi:hypothetical protein